MKKNYNQTIEQDETKSVQISCIIGSPMNL